MLKKTLTTLSIAAIAASTTALPTAQAASDIDTSVQIAACAPCAAKCAAKCAPCAAKCSPCAAKK